MTRPPVRTILWLALGGSALIGLLAVEAVRTRPVRGALRAYTELVAAANRGDLAAARGRLSSEYLHDHPVEVSPGGGIVGLPRGISPDFRAWRREEAVWICPTGRVGPVFRFVREQGRWTFDGPVGLLRPGGEVEILDVDVGTPATTPD